MGMQSAYFDHEAWLLTRERIGQGLCECCPVPQDLPAQFLTLIEKLTTSELPRQTLPAWLRKFDAIEGNLLLRGFRKRQAVAVT